MRHTHSGRQPPGSGRQLPGSGRMWLPNPFELTNIDKVCKCKMHIESTAARMPPGARRRAARDASRVADARRATPRRDAAHEGGLRRGVTLSIFAGRRQYSKRYSQKCLKREPGCPKYQKYQKYQLCGRTSAPGVSDLRFAAFLPIVPASGACGLLGPPSGTCGVLGPAILREYQIGGFYLLLIIFCYLK